MSYWHLGIIHWAIDIWESYNELLTFGNHTLSYWHLGIIHWAIAIWESYNELLTFGNHTLSYWHLGTIHWAIDIWEPYNELLTFGNHTMRYWHLEPIQWAYNIWDPHKLQNNYCHIGTIGAGNIHESSRWVGELYYYLGTAQWSGTIETRWYAGYNQLNWTVSQIKKYQFIILFNFNEIY